MLIRAMKEKRWSIHIWRIFGSSQNILQMLCENWVRNIKMYPMFHGSREVHFFSS